MRLNEISRSEGSKRSKEDQQLNLGALQQLKKKRNGRRGESGKKTKKEQLVREEENEESLVFWMPSEV